MQGKSQLFESLFYSHLYLDILQLKDITITTISILKFISEPQLLSDLFQ